MALGIPMALMLSGAISGGSGILGGLLSRKKGAEDETNPEDYLAYKQLPDYEESNSARQDWSKKLQELS